MTSFVLVHGGFTDGWYWGPTADRLTAQGHRVHVAELPSTGPQPDGLGGPPEDVECVRGLVAAAGEPVVLVGHSSGGMVITELADDPRVAHSVYLAAFWPRRGQSILDMGASEVDWVVPSEDGSAVRVTDDLDRAVEVLCADLDPALVPEWRTHCLYSSAAGFGFASTAPDRTHPTTYVVLEKDNAIPPAAQEALAAAADHVERLATSHQAMLVDPDGLTAILTRIPA